MIRFRTTRTPALACPTCGARLDAATSWHGAEPRPGDFSLCFYCADALIFTADMRLRVATAAQLDALNDEQRQFISRLRAAVRTKGERARA